MANRYQAYPGFVVLDSTASLDTLDVRGKPIAWVIQRRHVIEWLSLDESDMAIPITACGREDLESRVIGRELWVSALMQPDGSIIDENGTYYSDEDAWLQQGVEPAALRQRAEEAA